MAFIQQGPRLAHPLHHDRVLRAWLRATFDASERAALEADLTALGDYALLAHAPCRAACLFRLPVVSWRRDSPTPRAIASRAR